MIVSDKIEVATRKFGRQVTRAAKAAAAAFVDAMIAKGAWSTTQNDFGGTMHQFQPEAYRAALAELQGADAIVQQSRQGGELFWVEKFAGLTESTGQ